MKTAELIATESIDAADAMDRAEKCAIAKDQDWQEESTTWTFDDNSTLTVSEVEVTAKDWDE